LRNFIVEKELRINLNEQLKEIQKRLEEIYTGYAEYLADQDLVILKLAQEIIKEKESKNLK
jgi:hypothetical protein